MFGGEDNKPNTNQEGPKSIFGGGAPLFGQNSAPTFGQTTPIFGANVDSSPKPVFGQTLFGSKSDSSTPDVEVIQKPTFGLFGSKTDSPKAEGELISKPILGQNLFGAKTDSTKAEVEASPKPVFGQTLFGGVSESKPLFGGEVESSPKPVFGQSLFGSGVDSSPKPVFGQNIFGSKQDDSSIPTDLSSKPVFGQSANIFNTKVENNSKPVFGQTASLFDGAKDITPKSTTTNIFGSNANSNIENNLFKSSGIDFASLASASPITSTTLTANNKVEFVGLTNNNSFQSFQKAKDKDNSTTEDGDNYTNDENHDPQFEPIIDLPPEIVLSTGEENETKKFGERAKLFRFDEEAKQWKERGL